MFGTPNQYPYDGLHMNGHAGKHVFQKSILNILRNAGLCKVITDVPEGRKTDRGRYTRAGPTNQEQASHGRKTNQYDPLKMFRERLSSTQRERSSSSDKTSEQNQKQ